jgi:hypothetical protein
MKKGSCIIKNVKIKNRKKEVLFGDCSIASNQNRKQQKR